MGRVNGCAIAKDSSTPRLLRWRDGSSDEIEIETRSIIKHLDHHQGDSAIDRSSIDLIVSPRSKARVRIDMAAH